MSDGGHMITNSAVGIGGTVATVSLAEYNLLVAICAGLLTCAWMGRQLWLSFQKKGHESK